jgi:hypothetical protein
MAKEIRTETFAAGIRPEYVCRDEVYGTGTTLRGSWS